MRRYVLVFTVFLFVTLPMTALASHGISIDGKLKYPKEFTQFDYTKATAPKGGNVTLHDLGSFDKMNPFTLKGTAPAGLGNLVFEPLAVASLDEPFAKYGLIARDIKLADDHMSVTFTLNPAAHFSDGTTVTVEDVLFSLNTLKSEAAHPFYQAYFNDIRSAEIVSPSQIRFHFSQKNRELHLIAAELPILSRTFYQKHPFGTESLVPPIGSGPYIVDNVQPGKGITYRRNPHYWAENHPTRKGMFNFDSITYKYFKDQLVSVEAFKAHEFDIMPVNIAKQWVRDLSGSKFESGEIVKKYLPHHNNAGMQCFVMNLRRPLFQDRNVREALGLLFDFQWTNKSLFFDQYTQSSSYFSNTHLAATGLPQGLELQYLEPLRGMIPEEVFTKELIPVSTAPPGSIRRNMRRAQKLLQKAGWIVRDGKLTRQEDPQQNFSFEILLVSPSFERVMAPYVRNMQKLGMQVSYRTIDPALYTRRIQKFDFDMVVNVFGQSQSPGNEQRDYWHSSSAAREGSRNLIGLKDHAVDALTEKIIYAATQEELSAACKALDRVLWFGYYVVPNWFVAKHRVAYFDIFGQPSSLPLYYSPDQVFMTWWLK